MTPEEFRATGTAIFGERWQTAMARWLGLSDARSVRRWASGASPVPPQVEQSLRERMSCPEPFPLHDAWIFGEGADHGCEYVVHTQPPRFIARIYPESELVQGRAWACSSGEQIAEFAWIDKAPDGNSFRQLMQACEAALDSYSEIT